MTGRIGIKKNSTTLLHSIKARSWTHPRRIWYKSTAKQPIWLLDMNYHNQIYQKNLSAEAGLFKPILKEHHGKNYIKEAKNGFYFDKTNRRRFLENHARIWWVYLAFKHSSIYASLLFYERKPEVSSFQLFRCSYKDSAVKNLFPFWTEKPFYNSVPWSRLPWTFHKSCGIFSISRIGSNTHTLMK